MKAVWDIIYKKEPTEPVKPGIFSLVNVGAVVYVLYLFDKERLSGIDFFLIPAFILAIGLQIYFYFKKKRG